jgi:hypothetical protein
MPHKFDPKSIERLDDPKRAHSYHYVLEAFFWHALLYTV